MQHKRTPYAEFYDYGRLEKAAHDLHWEETEENEILLINLHNQLVWHLYRFDEDPRADAILYAVIEAILGEIEIWNEEDGPIARITVCITGSMLAEDEVVLDTNNCPWAVGFVESNGLGEDTGRTVRSGYCTYPVVKLNVEKIGEYLEVA